eukprot:596102-Hanusia_phi.AAC.1
MLVTGPEPPSLPPPSSCFSSSLLPPPSSCFSSSAYCLPANSQLVADPLLRAQAKSLLTSAGDDAPRQPRFALGNEGWNRETRGRQQPEGIGEEAARGRMSWMLPTGTKDKQRDLEAQLEKIEERFSNGRLDLWEYTQEKEQVRGGGRRGGDGTAASLSAGQADPPGRRQRASEGDEARRTHAAQEARRARRTTAADAEAGGGGGGGGGGGEKFQGRDRVGGRLELERGAGRRGGAVACVSRVERRQGGRARGEARARAMQELREEEGDLRLPYRRILRQHIVVLFGKGGPVGGLLGGRVVGSLRRRREGKQAGINLS